jgi:tRNA(Ile)-lysidine synthase
VPQSLIAPARSESALKARLWAALVARLDPASCAPIALALSGGGDSLALLSLVMDWAGPVGRRVLALTVDHGLQAGSAAWTEAAGAGARRLGADWRALAWLGEKPSAGLPQAARRARHALLADAARAAGAGVLMLGHTADDVVETDILRAEGVPLGRLRDWGPSPAWPEGRGVYLLRPLLDVTRAELRAYLTARGMDWLEDPANGDVRFARARVRAALTAEPTDKGSRRLQVLHPGRSETETRDRHKRCGLYGPGQSLRDVRDDEIRSFGASRHLLPQGEKDLSGALTLPRDIDHAALAMAVVCAAGHDQPPRGHSVERLRARLAAGARFTATLAGARIEAGDTVEIFREAGETSRGGLTPLRLAAGQVGVWDGRFEITADAACEVRALKGLAKRLSCAERARLSRVAPSARPGLPVLIRDGEARPVLAGRSARVFNLVERRWRAACGVNAHESEIA